MDCGRQVGNGGAGNRVTVDDMTVPASIPVLDLAELMDECSDSSGSWSGSDVCDALAALIERHGGWARCPEHSLYSAAKTSCPFEHDDIDGEDEA